MGAVGDGGSQICAMIWGDLGNPATRSACAQARAVLRVRFESSVAQYAEQPTGYLWANTAALRKEEADCLRVAGFLMIMSSENY